MADNELNITGSDSSSGGGHRWLRLIIFVGITVGVAAAARRWAMSKTDAEFEQRLRAADERRD
jgi:hypothetical protein